MYNLYIYILLMIYTDSSDERVLQVGDSYIPDAPPRSKVIQITPRQYEKLHDGLLLESANKYVCVTCHMSPVIPMTPGNTYTKRVNSDKGVLCVAISFQMDK